METPVAAKPPFPARAAAVTALAAFAVFAAYTQRMPSPFGGEMPAGTFGWHRAVAEFCHRLWRGDELIGWAFPTILAGTLAATLFFLTVARRNLTTAVVAAAALIGCRGLIIDIRWCRSDIFIMLAVLAAVYGAGFLKGKLGSALILLWLAFWLVSGIPLPHWKSVLNALTTYSLLAPLAVVCGVIQLVRLVRAKKPEWQLVVTGVTPLLLLADDRVWFFSLPLAAWTVGEVLTDETLKLRNYLLWMLRAVPALGLAGFVGWAQLAKERFPDYPLPFLIPALTLAILLLGSFAVAKLEEKPRNLVIICSAFAVSAVVEVMVIEPFNWFMLNR